MFVITTILLCQGSLFRGSVPYILLSLWPGRRISFVIPRTSLYRGLLNRGPTVLSSNFFIKMQVNELACVLTMACSVKKVCIRFHVHALNCENLPLKWCPDLTKSTGKSHRGRNCYGRKFSPPAPPPSPHLPLQFYPFNSGGRQGMHNYIIPCHRKYGGQVGY